MDAVGLSAELLVLARAVTGRGRPGRPRSAIVVPGFDVHGKLVLVRGSNGVVLQIGSPNLTFAGLGGHYREVVCTFIVDVYSGARRLAFQTCEWLLEGLADSPLGFPQQARWTDRIRDLSALFGDAQGDSAGGPWLLTNSNRSLSQQIAEFFSPRTATVLSPYVHPAALQALGATDLTTIVPTDDVRRRLQGSFSDWAAVRRGVRVWRDDKRFTHAKVYLLRGTRNCVLIGSANCTCTGLVCRAGQAIGGRKAWAELLVCITLSPAAARRIDTAFRSASSPLSLTPADLAEDEIEIECSPPTLLTWADADGALSLGFSGATPSRGDPALRRNGHLVSSLRPLVNGGPQCVQWRPPGERSGQQAWLGKWRQAAKSGEPGWEVQWGELTADVEFLLAPELQDSVEALWGTGGQWSTTGRPRVGDGMARRRLPTSRRSRPVSTSLNAALAEWRTPFRRTLKVGCQRPPVASTFFGDIIASWAWSV